MSLFIADPSTWYALTYGNHTGIYGVYQPSWLVPNIFVGGAHAGVGSQPPDGLLHPNLTQYTQLHWQFYPISQPPNGTYFLRSRYQETAFLNSFNMEYNDSSCTSIGWDCSIGIELNTILPVGSIWTFTQAQQGNNSYHITNRPYGNNSRLDVFPDWQRLRMSPNITDYQPAQQWQIFPVTQINNTADYSIDSSILNFTGSANVPTHIAGLPSASASSTSTQSMSTPSSTSPSSTLPASATTPPSTTQHSGLSTGAKAGIGAGVGVSLALILAGLLFWLLRKKKSKTAYTRSRSSSGPPSYHQDSGTQVDKLHQDMEEASRMPLVEAHSEAAVEAPSNPARYELPTEFNRHGEIASENGSNGNNTADFSGLHDNVDFGPSFLPSQA